MARCRAPVSSVWPLPTAPKSFAFSPSAEAGAADAVNNMDASEGCGGDGGGACGRRYDGRAFAVPWLLLAVASSKISSGALIIPTPSSDGDCDVCECS